MKGTYMYEKGYGFEPFVSVSSRAKAKKEGTFPLILPFDLAILWIVKADKSLVTQKR